MNVLVINCGSSSLKYQVINSDTEQVLAKGLCERIGIDGRLVYTPAGGEKEISNLDMPTHKQAIQYVIDALTNEKTGVINSILSVLHLPSLNIINTPYAIVLGMVYNFLPFMVLPLYNVLVKIDKNVINAAYDLGANGIQTFLRIIFPLSLPGMFSGITMVFVPALTTFVISKILGGSKILLIGNVIEQEVTQTGNWNLGSGLSIVLMLFIIFNMVISVITDKEGEANTL